MSYSWSSSSFTPSRSKVKRARGRPTAQPSGRPTGLTYTRLKRDDTRTYKGRSQETRKNVIYPLNRIISTKSTHPLVIAIDVTASMEEWPRIFFEKLPLLYVEVAQSRPEVEISFCAVGDAHTDEYPLQVRDFGAGEVLDDCINRLFPEAGGGGQARETYELAAYFYTRHCMMPKAKKPVFIFLGDEGIYDYIHPNHIRDIIGDTASSPLDSEEVFGQLKELFDVYIIRKEYPDFLEANIHAQWCEYLGEDKVLLLEDPKRVVDCIIGVVSAVDESFVDYSNRLRARQQPKQVDEVMKTLEPIINIYGTVAGDVIVGDHAAVIKDSVIQRSQISTGKDSSDTSGSGSGAGPVKIEDSVVIRSEIGASSHKKDEKNPKKETEKGNEQ